jgi:hypothetical protein
MGLNISLQRILRRAILQAHRLLRAVDSEGHAPWFRHSRHDLRGPGGRPVLQTRLACRHRMRNGGSRYRGAARQP